MIGKLETMSADVKYLTEKFPYMAKYLETDIRMNSREASSHYAEYISQLSLKQKLDLCEFYKWDMKMFNYTCLEFP